MMTDSIRSSRNFLHTPFTLFRRKEFSLCPPTATDHYPKTKLLRPTRRNPTILQQTLFISSPTTTIILDTTCYTSGEPLLAGVQKAQTWYFDSDFLFSCGAPKRLLVRRASSVFFYSLAVCSMVRLLEGRQEEMVWKLTTGRGRKGNFV
jgi:hypothetical protein